MRPRMCGLLVANLAIPTVIVSCCRKSCCVCQGASRRESRVIARRLSLQSRSGRQQCGEHEKKLGSDDDAWPDRYAEYMVNEQTGKPLPFQAAATLTPAEHPH